MTKDDLIESNKQAFQTIRSVLAEANGMDRQDRELINACADIARQQWYLIDNEKLKEKRR